MGITILDIQKAVSTAVKGREKRPDVAAFMERYSENVQEIYASLLDGSYMECVDYIEMERRNKNGKLRHILSPKLRTLILQHLCCMKLNDYYMPRDNGVGLNCKEECGITAKTRRKSVLKRAKRLFYDRREYHYLLVIDQRRCYDHIKPKILRKALKYMGVPKWLNDFACNICFFKGTFPIGTPTSPLAHHCIMLKFDRFVSGMGGVAFRYADDCFVAFRSKEEANAALWRIKNFWWYELGIRAKRHTTHIYNIDKHASDICGYRIKRNPGKNVTSHDKGFTRVRKSTVESARRSTNKNWGCYFGLLVHADAYSLMCKIEKDMKLSQLTEKIRINRNLDADPIAIKDLAEQSAVFTIYDYDIKFQRSEPDWIKCLIGIHDESSDKDRAYEFHGSYHGIAQFIHDCEKEFGKTNILPIEEVSVENRCGYIIKDSTNVIKYIG